jgi:hypothetical protein
MNCKEFQIEFEETRVLSETATLHIGECPDCKVLHLELMQVWQMIEALPRVEAPSDFDFRLKARMANAKPSDFQPRWWNSLRYVVPVFAAALILTLVLASQNFFITSPEVSLGTIEVQESQIMTPQVRRDVQPESVVANNSNSGEVGNPPVVSPELNNFFSENSNQKSEVFVARNSDLRKKTVPGKEVRVGFDGSRDILLKESGPVKLPSGMQNMNSKPIANPAEVIQVKPIPVEDILSEIGIETVLENGKRKVKSVGQNSPALRSGVQVGDEIEAIDENKLDKPIQSPAIKVKVLTVMRDGKPVKIPLSSEPQ